MANIKWPTYDGQHTDLCWSRSGCLNFTKKKIPFKSWWRSSWLRTTTSTKLGHNKSVINKRNLNPSLIGTVWLPVHGKTQHSKATSSNLNRLTEDACPCDAKERIHHNPNAAKRTAQTELSQQHQLFTDRINREISVCGEKNANKLRYVLLQFHTECGKFCLSEILIC